MTATVPTARLEPLEIAAGVSLEPLGRVPRRPLPPADRRGSRVVLEDVIATAMQAGRTSVSFSGGRDSSLILAIATSVARREGFEDPVAITMRHPSPESREDEWQEQVVRHLGLVDWERVEVVDRMDLLGVEATDLYERVGLHYPANSYLHLSMLDVAPEGPMFTGIGGDEVLGSSGWHLARVLAGHTPPTPRDLLRLAFTIAPRRARLTWQQRKETLWSTWLTEQAAHDVRRRLASAEVQTRLDTAAGFAVFLRSRGLMLGREAMQVVGASRGVEIVSPLWDERFVVTFAREHSRGGPRSRDDATRLLGGDVLPERTVLRQTKASFGAMVWGPRFRDFVEQWDPSTLDPAVAGNVHIPALRQAWRAATPPFQALLIAQRAWLDQREASRAS